MIQSDEASDEELGFFIYPAFFGFLRGLGRLQDGFSRIFPLKKIRDKSPPEFEETDLTKLGHVIPPDQKFENFSFSENTLEIVRDIYQHFSEGNSRMDNFLAGDKSFYDDFIDYGVINSASLFTALLRPELKDSPVVVDMRQIAKTTLQKYLSTIEDLRVAKDEAHVTSNDPKSVNFVVRKVTAIRSCSYTSIVTAQSERDCQETLTQITSRLMAPDSTKLIVIGQSLFVDLLQGIRKLCESFPPLVPDGIGKIKDFLLTPAPAEDAKIIIFQL